MNHAALRRHLVALLEGRGAHGELGETLSAFPRAMAGSGVPGVAHTPWRLLEHMRIAQWDILEFCRNPAHVSPDFPDGYWPPENAPASETDWDEAVARFMADLKAMQAYVSDPSIDLFAPIPHGDGQTVLREALLVADHNSYHLGQLVLIRKGVSGA